MKKRIWVKLDKAENRHTYHLQVKKYDWLPFWKEVDWHYSIEEVMRYYMEYDKPKFVEHEYIVQEIT